MIPQELTRAFNIEELPVACWAAEPPVQLTARRPWAGSLGRDLAAALMHVLQERSVVLLRGTGRVTAASAAAFARAMFAGLPAYQTGEHPAVAGTASLYQPVRFAPEEFLLWHHEDSFSASWPSLIMFACAVPAAQGGYTTLVDSRWVYARVRDEVAKPLRDQGVRYERICDGMAGRTWQEIYGTEFPAEALRRAAENGEELVFSGKDHARIRAVRPAFLPTEHGISWFNQILHWHPRALPAELRDMVADGLLPAYRTCAVGDGHPIPDSHIDQVIDVHQETEYRLAWQPGDILLIDNRVVAHGRTPYRGRREHFVWMAGTDSWPKDAARAR